MLNDTASQSSLQLLMFGNIAMYYVLSYNRKKEGKVKHQITTKLIRFRNKANDLFTLP